MNKLNKLLDRIADPKLKEEILQEINREGILRAQVIWCIYPWKIKSKNDEDYHYIDPYRLIELYGLPPKRCICIQSPIDVPFNTPEYIYILLTVRYDGRYCQYLKSVKETYGLE